MVIKCSRGHENPDEAVFCAECGEPFGFDKRQLCVNCGTRYTTRILHCTACGYALPGIPTPTSITNVRAEQSPQKTAPPAGFTLQKMIALPKNAKMVGIAWSSDGQTLAICAEDNNVYIWHRQSNMVIPILPFKNDKIYSLAWSPRGHILAIGFGSGRIGLWNRLTGQLLSKGPDGHYNTVYSLSWSSETNTLASSSRDSSIKFWKIASGQDIPSTLFDEVYSIAWSPDGQTLACGIGKKAIHLSVPLDEYASQAHSLIGENKFQDSILSLAWSPDGSKIASGSYNNTVMLWDAIRGNLLRQLEGHTNGIACVVFSPDGRLLLSKAWDNSIRVWSTATWEELTFLSSPSVHVWNQDMAFCPDSSLLATIGANNKELSLYELAIDTILNLSQSTESTSYTTAKVVLLGDSGVGKSGLGLVLGGQEFEATDSTHGRRIWTFDHQETARGNRRKETREIMLWDLAGQSGYRLIHQLYLDEVAVALVVFNAQSETDPFAGVYYWERALRQAQKIQGSAAAPLKKFLVAARVDRSSIGVSHARIQELLNEFDFAGYFATSAKAGWQIAELQEAIRNAIDWDALTSVSSTQLFQQIKNFLVKEKGRAQHLISSNEELYHTFLHFTDAPEDTFDLHAQFEICMRLVEATGLIKRLSFGQLVILQPELLDAYASALTNAVSTEPDGLGSILEERVRRADFQMPKSERVTDNKQEELLLIAMIEDLLRRELALRDGEYLIFPSQSTRENPDLPNPEGKTVIFEFKGPVFNIYATLAVRLANSGLFMKKALWKNAITYTAKVGGTCGLFLHNVDEGRGELVLFFDELTSKDTQTNFEEYVHLHLQRKALPDIKVRRMISCSVCQFSITNEMVKRRQERGFDWLNCPICDTRISFIENEALTEQRLSSNIKKMDRTADIQRDKEVNKTTTEGKEIIAEFDVFLCYNHKDKAEVKEIEQLLREWGILPWLDEVELPLGEQWQPLVEEQIKKIPGAVAFIGKGSLGDWQKKEIYAFLSRNRPVIPAILTNVVGDPDLPPFLDGRTRVDFRKNNPNPLDYLAAGIKRWRSS